MQKRGTGAAVLVVVMGAIGPAAAVAAADIRADTLLAQARAASGGDAWNQIRTMQMESTLQLGADRGTFESKIDLTGLREVTHFQLGPIAGAFAWDGAQAWSMDPAGKVQVEREPAAVAERRTALYSDAFCVFFPQRAPASISYAGTREDRGSAFHAVKIEPRAGTAFEVWINRHTHRIERQVALGGQAPQTQIFEDFRQVQGVMLPFATRTLLPGDQPVQSATVTSVRINVAMDASTFAPPAVATSTGGTH